MKIDTLNPPRKYNVGKDKDITISEMGRVYLDDDEQITLMTSDDKEYDICKKSWGYYATPSVNDRLKKFFLKTALVRNKKGQVYIMLVEKDKVSEFEKYLFNEQNYLLEWLDERPLE